MIKALYRPLKSEDDHWRELFAAVVCAFLLYMSVRVALPGSVRALGSSLLKPLTMLLAVLYFSRMRLSGTPEFKLLLVFSLWGMVSRFLIPNFYKDLDSYIFYAFMLFCMVLPAGLLLDARRRETMLDWICALGGGLFFLCAASGLYVALSGNNISLPWMDNAVYFMWEGVAYKALTLFETSHNISALWLFIGLCLTIYQLLRRNGLLWRIPLCIAAVVLYLGIALCHCRTVQFVTAMGLGMLALLLGMRYLRLRSKIAQVVVLCVLTLGVMIIGFFGFNVSVSAISSVTAAEAPASPASPASPVTADTAPGETFEDSRSVLEAMMTFTDRTYIWQGVFRSLASEPRIILTGENETDVMPLVNKNIPQDSPAAKGYKFHTHNSFLQTLMLTGTPGLALIGAFCVLLVVRMLRIFFAPADSVSLAIKSLTIPLAGILVAALLESFLFTTLTMRNIWFYFLAGVFLAYSYELLPSKKKK